MAWWKIQTAIGVVVGALLAASAITFVVKRNEARDSWEVLPKNGLAFRAALAALNHVPPQVRILPTKFPNLGEFYGSTGGKMMGLDVSIKEMAQVAFANPPENLWDSARTFVSPDVPQGHYDFIANLPDGSEPALQKEMKRKFGVVAKPVMRNEDILRLAVKNANAPGLKRGKPRGRSYWKPLPGGEASFINYKMSEFVSFLQPILKVPVVDGTDLSGNFDFRINDSPSALRQSLRDELGLILVSTNMPIEILVVEKAR